VGVWVWIGGWVGVYTKSKSSELSPLRRKLLRFAKQFPSPLRSNNFSGIHIIQIIDQHKFVHSLHRAGARALPFCRCLLPFCRVAVQENILQENILQGSLLHLGSKKCGR
jgi:hypothetical protein